MRYILLLLFLLTAGSMANGQYSERMSRPEYFERYSEIAIHEMQRSGVPASITLAQGALESGDGNSRLARSGNNHFGIKCHDDWNGKRIFEDDDARNECFRKYRSVEDSYRDHSDYLRSKSRYAFLFDLPVTDYKGWARGLKKAGYATSPSYAQSLIKIIEDYNLDLYDRTGGASVRNHEKERERNAGRSISSISRPVLERNRVKYIVARPGDTYESITDELGKLSWEIPQYNDLNGSDTLVTGQVVFIQPKRNKAEIGKKEHIVKQGETMYTISQLYGIKLARLYAMNNMNPGTRPAVGTILQLRKTVKRSVVKSAVDDIGQGGEDGEEIRIDLNME